MHQQVTILIQNAHCAAQGTENDSYKITAQPCSHVVYTVKNCTEFLARKYLIFIFIVYNKLQLIQRNCHKYKCITDRLMALGKLQIYISIHLLLKVLKSKIII